MYLEGQIINPKFKYYKVQNKPQIPNSKKERLVLLVFGFWILILFGSIGSIWIFF